MSRWASYDDARDVLEVEDDDCCPDCLGEGFYHDCGEDTCCCAYPDEDDMQPPSPTPSPADQEGA